MKNKILQIIILLLVIISCKKEVYGQVQKETDSQISARLLKEHIECQKYKDYNECDKILFQIQDLNAKQNDLKENALQQFLNYTGEILINNRMLGETYDFHGDLTHDNKDDEIIYYQVIDKITHEVLNRRIALFINENDQMIQYPDFTPNYRFAVSDIENNTIKIVKLEFAKDDDREEEPTIRIPVKLILDKNKKYIEVK